MSARSRAIQEALGLARDAILFGRSHVAVLGDREILRQLPEMLAAKLRDEIDAVTVRLAGRQETVADCLAEAIRGARRAGDAESTEGRERSRLALLIPDALAIPASSLRSLHELASRMGAHRLVLLVDRETRQVDNPVMEVVARLGAAVLTVQIDLPEPEPVAVPTLEDLLGEPAKPRAEDREGPDPEPDRAEAAAPPAEPGAAAEAPAEVDSPPVAAPTQTPESLPPGPPGPPARAPERARARGAGLWLRAVTAVGVAAFALGVAAFVAAPGIVYQVRDALEARGLLALPDSHEQRSETPPAPAADAVTSVEPELEAVPGAAPPPPVRPAAPSADPASAALPAAPAPVARAPEPKPPPKPPVRVASKPEPQPKSTAPPAAKARPASRKPRAAAPAPPLRVNFNAVPWADLVVDGKRLGPTPLAGVQLSAGPHEVRATFPDGRVVRRRIEVDARRTRFRIE